MKTIGEISHRYGLSLRTMRFYEELGLLKPKRVGTKRLYSARDEIRLQLITVGRTLRFSLKEIASLIASREELDEERADIFAYLDIAMIEERIEALEEAKNSVETSILDLKMAKVA